VGSVNPSETRIGFLFFFEKNDKNNFPWVKFSPTSTHPGSAQWNKAASFGMTTDPEDVFKVSAWVVYVQNSMGAAGENHRNKITTGASSSKFSHSTFSDDVVVGRRIDPTMGFVLESS
jgi:hypothetical protein